MGLQAYRMTRVARTCEKGDSIGDSMFSSSLSAGGSGDRKVTPLLFAFFVGVFALPAICGSAALLRSPRIRRGDLLFGVLAFGAVAATATAGSFGDVSDSCNDTHLPRHSGVAPVPALPRLGAAGDWAQRLFWKPVVGSATAPTPETVSHFDGDGALPGASSGLNDCGSEPR